MTATHMRWNDHDTKEEQESFERKVVMIAVAAFLLILLTGSVECQTVPGKVAATAEKVGATGTEKILRASDASSLTVRSDASSLTVPDSLALRSVQLKISAAESQLYQLILQVQRLEAEVRKQKSEMDQLVDGIRKTYACPAPTCGFEDGENGIITIDRSHKPDRPDHPAVDRPSSPDRPASTTTKKR